MRRYAFKAGTESRRQSHFFQRDVMGETELDQVLVRNRVVLRQRILSCGGRVSEIADVLVLRSNEITPITVNFLFTEHSEGLCLKRNSPACGSWLDRIVNGSGGG